MAKSKSSTEFSSADYSLPESATSYVVCGMRYDSQIAPTRAGAMAAAPAAEPQKIRLERVLNKFDVQRVVPHFAGKQSDMRVRVAAAGFAPAAPAPSTEFALAGFMRVEVATRKQAEKLASQLASEPTVWKAYVAPHPEPAAVTRRAKKGPRRVRVPAGGPIGNDAGSRNFEPTQGYLYSAPDGISAADVWVLGATGKAVTVCDIEGAWKLDHEDLPQDITLVGGKMIQDPAWRNHGTAVLGEMVSVRGNIGCCGICHGAKAKVQSAMIDGVFNAAGAIQNAAANLSTGDVILIELHAPGGPDNKYVAMQHWPDIFAAIKAAVAQGIVVVEAAGNGDENFDRPEYAGNGLQKDSGAIMVGAGVPPANYFDAYGFYGDWIYERMGTPRSRIWFSNYGQQVNVQGWGWHVTTLGYGDAQGGPEKSWYTLRFSGTSSASPIITGSAVCLQSYSKAKRGSVLTPSQVRDILMSTGTPQEDDAPRAPIAQKIGPQPNLVRALQAIDVLP